MDASPGWPPPTHLDAVPGTGGVVWSASPEGLHANLVVLGPGESIASHVNDSLDVLVVVLTGAVTATVDGADQHLHPHDAALLPRGARRALRAGDAGARYLSIHAARPPFGIGPRTTS